MFYTDITIPSVFNNRTVIIPSFNVHTITIQSSMIKRNRLLREIDSNTLSALDELALDNIDYVEI